MVKVGCAGRLSAALVPVLLEACAKASRFELDLTDLF